HAAIADLALRADERPWTDAHVLAERCRRRDDGRGVDLPVHASRTIAAISASATISPSTFAIPFMRQMRPRTCITSSSNRSWSPGFTGLRHFTLSSDMK